MDLIERASAMDLMIHNKNNFLSLSEPLKTFNGTKFVPKPFYPSNDIQNLHSINRFGHTNNIEILIKGISDSNMSSQAESYIVGVCSAAILIFCIALVWFITIVVLKYCGQKKVGFLAGRLVHPNYDEDAESEEQTRLSTIQEEPTVTVDGLEYEDSVHSSSSDNGSSLVNPLLTNPLIPDDELVKAATKDNQFKRTVFAVRAVFVLSGIFVIISGGLFYGKGVTGFKRSLDSTSHGLMLLQDTAYKIIEITGAVNKDKNELITDFNDFNNITKSVASSASSNNDELCRGQGEIARDVNHNVDKFKEYVKPLSDAVDENVKLFQEDLQQVITITEEVDGHLTDTKAFFYVTISIFIIIGTLILSMLSVVAFSAKGVDNCCTRFSTKAILWPIFIFFLILFWIFTLVSLVMALSGADFCVNPDRLVENILYYYEDMFHSVVFKYIIYYVSSCAIKPTGGEMANITNTINKGVHTIHHISEMLMDMPIKSIQSECALSSTVASSVHGGAILMHNATHSLNDAWIGVQDLMECKTFNPIYTTFVHDAICVDGVGGLAWLFSTSLFLAIFSMVMIMFRAALYPVKRPSVRPNSGLTESLLSKSSRGQHANGLWSSVPLFSRPDMATQTNNVYHSV